MLNRFALTDATRARRRAAPYYCAARSIALAALLIAIQTSAAGSNPIGQELFADRFATGIVAVATDGAVRYNRRHGQIVVPGECARSYSITPIATPVGAPWSFAYQPLLPTMTLQGEGFTYRRPCGQAAGSTQISASHPPLSDAVELVFVKVAQITRLEGAQTYTVSDSVITVPLECAVPFTGQLFVNAPGTYVFTYDDQPTGFLADSSGSFTYTPVCGENTSLRVQASLSTSTTPPLRVSFTLSNPPVFSGVDLDSDGLVDLVNGSGSLSDFFWLRGFPVTVGLVGDADSYSASIGSISGSDWSFTESVGGSYTLIAHRDGLDDSASGSLVLRDPVLERLGAHDFVSGSASFSVPCGSEFVGALVTNTDDLLPLVTDSYSSSDLPVGASLVGDVFSYTPSCVLGSPENVSFALTPTLSSGSDSQLLDEYLVDVSITGVEQSPPFTIQGLDFENNGSVSSTPYHGTWSDADNDGTIDQAVKVRAGRSAVNAWEAYVLTSDGKSVTLDPQSTLPSYITVSGNMIEYLPDDEHIGETGSLEFLVCDEVDTADCRSLSVPYEVVPREPVIVGLSYSQENGTIDNPVDGGGFSDINTVDCQLAEIDRRYVVAEPYDFEYNYTISNPAPNMGIDGGTGSIGFNANCGQAGQTYFPSVQVTGSGGQSSWVSSVYQVE